MQCSPLSHAQTSLVSSLHALPWSKYDCPFFSSRSQEQEEFCISCECVSWCFIFKDGTLGKQQFGPSRDLLLYWLLYSVDEFCDRDEEIIVFVSVCVLICLISFIKLQLVHHTTGPPNTTSKQTEQNKR